MFTEISLAALTALAPMTTPVPDTIHHVILTTNNVPNVFSGVFGTDGDPWYTFKGTCPSSHPYLTDTDFNTGRVSPNGVFYVASTYITASARTVTLPDSYMVAGIQGEYKNWDVVTGHITITLECTKNRWQAQW
jgi:hypothetical protein